MKMIVQVWIGNTNCCSLVYGDRNEKSYRAGTVGGLKETEGRREKGKERETTKGGREGVEMCVAVTKTTVLHHM